MFPLKLTLYFVIFYICEVKNLESESFETNRLDDEEISPLYNTVVFSDIADIMTDFQTNPDPGYNHEYRPRDSESDENIEDLVSEYQTYLDKKFKRANNNHAKSRQSRNKMSLFKQGLNKNPKENKYSDYTYSPVREFFIPKFKELDFVFPLDATLNEKQSNAVGSKSGFVKKDISRTKLTGLQVQAEDPNFRHFGPPIPSSCICSKEEIPCDCGCKECLLPFTPEAKNKVKRVSKNLSPRFITDPKKISKELSTSFAKLFIGSSDNDFYSSASKEVNAKDEHSHDNTLNINLKVEIQLPEKYRDNESNRQHHSQVKTWDNIDNTQTKILPVATFPFTNFQFPFPLDSLGSSKILKPSHNLYETLHTVNDYQKNKSKHSNKKHLKTSGISKHVTASTINNPLEMSPMNNSKDPKLEMVTDTGGISATFLNDNTTTKNILSETTKTILMEPIVQKNTTLTPLNENMVIVSHSTDTKEILFKNNTEVTTENVKTLQLKIEENSQGTVPTIKKKRSITADNTGKENFPIKVTIQKIVLNSNSTKASEKHKSVKVLLLDDQLLYWPTAIVNKRIPSQDITTLRVQREINKSKLNLSRELIRDNHTKALEQAVFGDVDWRDIGAVAPVFMSFVGKYLTGVLTFCSDTICHSIKCENKQCMHRVCAPGDRHNHIAHCLTSNSDSIATMDSTMDLPSNTVLELANILEDKLQGKMYGKATLCISTKCVTLAAAKKSFVKTKCATTELDYRKHCSLDKKVYNL